MFWGQQLFVQKYFGLWVGLGGGLRWIESFSVSVFCFINFLLYTFFALKQILVPKIHVGYTYFWVLKHFWSMSCLKSKKVFGSKCRAHTILGPNSKGPKT